MPHAGRGSHSTVYIPFVLHLFSNRIAFEFDLIRSGAIAHWLTVLQPQATPELTDTGQLRLLIGSSAFARGGVEHKDEKLSGSNPAVSSISFLAKKDFLKKISHVNLDLNQLATSRHFSYPFHPKPKKKPVNLAALRIERDM